MPGHAPPGTEPAVDPFAGHSSDFGKILASLRSQLVLTNPLVCMQVIRVQFAQTVTMKITAAVAQYLKTTAKSIVPFVP